LLSNSEKSEIIPGCTVGSESSVYEITY